MRVSGAKSFTLAVAIVAAATINPRVLAQAPQSAAAREQDIEGVLEVVVEDAPNGSAIHNFLKTANEKILLHGRPDSGQLEGLTTDTPIRVHGRRVDANNLELGGGGGSVTTLGLATSNTFGEQKVAVILVNFQDDTSQPYTWNDAYNVTFGQASDFYRENSYGQAWLTGAVFGWFTIPLSTTTCDTDQIASLADKAATASGANLSGYARRIYAFPRNACSWWGLGTIGGNPSRAWIKGTYSLKVVAHEMGHNFGDYHSQSMPCDPSGCSQVEYGDDRDIMGGTATGHFNAYQKERFGWLNYSASPSIQTVTTSGSYFITSLENGTSPSAIKILKSATTSEKTYYYIEARGPMGYDAPYTGVDVHLGNQNSGNSSYEVDLDPTTSSFDSMLDPGQTFTDPAAGLTITTTSADASGAWISITYIGQPCVSSAPTVMLSPGSALTSPGVMTSYTMTVKNNDNSVCSTSAFDIGLAVPSAWTWTSAQPKINVAPGSTGGTTVYVTPPSSATGSAEVDASALRSGAPAGTGTAMLTVADSLAIGLKIVGGSQYQITATVAAGGTPMPGAVVNFTIIDPRGGATTVSGTTASNGQVIVKGRLKGKDPHGTYQVTATANAGGLTGSASGTFVY